MQMCASNNNKTIIFGAVILLISEKSHNGTHCKTRQIVYVTNKSDKFFLSRQACTELGIISVSFLTIGEVDDNKSSTLNASTDTSVEIIVIATTTTSTSESPKSTLTSNGSCPKRERDHQRGLQLCHSQLQKSVVKSYRLGF